MSDLIRQPSCWCGRLHCYSPPGAFVCKVSCGPGCQPPAPPVRIQLKRTKGWRKPPGAVNVARPTHWGNPFAVHAPTREGREARVRAQMVDGMAYFVPVTPGLAVELYRWYATELCPQVADLARRMLAGRDLACFCPLDQPCHADVLLEIANRQEDR